MQIKIAIKGLKAKASVGIYDWEKICRRSFLINAEITFDYDVTSDKIEDTIDYDKLCCNIVEFVGQTNCNLLERLSYNILQFIMRDDKVSHCKLEVVKRFAILNLSYLSVTLETSKLVS